MVSAAIALVAFATAPVGEESISAVATPPPRVAISTGALTLLGAPSREVEVRLSPTVTAYGCGQVVTIAAMAESSNVSWFSGHLGARIHLTGQAMNGFFLDGHAQLMKLGEVSLGPGVMAGYSLNLWQHLYLSGGLGGAFVYSPSRAMFFPLIEGDSGVWGVNPEVRLSAGVAF
jgi:hypothetical protein